MQDNGLTGASITHRTYVRIAVTAVLAAAFLPLIALAIDGRPAAIAIGTAIGAVAGLALVASFGLTGRSRPGTSGVSALAPTPELPADPAVPAPLFRDPVSAQLRNAILSISDGFVLWDADDRLVVQNRHALPPTWPDMPAGITFIDHVAAVFPRIDERSSGGDLAKWIETRCAWHREATGSHEIRMKDGRWMLMTERRADDGSTVGIYIDITDRKKAERQLARSERRLSHAQKLAEVGIWEWDCKSGEMYWSEILHRILGIPADTAPLSLDHYLLIVHPANRDLVRSTHKRLLSTGGQYNQEYQIIRPDGHTRTVRAEAEAIKDSAGRIIRVLGAVHDITELKSAERGLRRARDIADQANRAKSEFLANVSHELRTPLNAVIGFSEVMLQEVFGSLGNDRYREYAADIRQSGTHLLGVINDLLDFSKLEAGHLNLHIEPVDLAATVDKTIRLMRDRAEADNVALVADVARISLPFHADERKVTQILLNLVSNAIKFTPAGGRVIVRVTQTEEGIQIAVTDTGIGMSRDEIVLALSPFGQINSSANRRHTGTGLGLPLSKSLAELHGGALDVESAPGAGTTVTVRLPTAGLKEDGSREPALRLVIGGQQS